MSMQTAKGYKLPAGYSKVQNDMNTPFWPFEEMPVLEGTIIRKYTYTSKKNKKQVACVAIESKEGERYAQNIVTSLQAWHSDKRCKVGAKCVLMFLGFTKPKPGHSAAILIDGAFGK